MSKPIYIYSSSNYFHAVEHEPPSLKDTLYEACGKKIRRIDRLTQLALIGGFQCKSQFNLSKDTGLYLSSIYGSLSNSARVLSEIYQEGRPPKPLNFINSVSNAACFYLSEQFGLHSINQFVTRENFTFEAGLKLACLDLEIGNITAALVGVVCEVGSDIETHRQRLNITPEFSLAEGSHWLYVAQHLDDADPLVEIVKLVEPLSEDSVVELLRSEADESSSNLTVSFSHRVDETFKKNILQQLNVNEQSFLPTELRHEFAAGFQLCGYVEHCKKASGRPQRKERLAYLDKDDNQRWSLVVLKQC